MNQPAVRAPRHIIILLALAGLFVLSGGLYIGVQSLSAVRRIRSFYDVEVFGLRESGEMAFNIQESRRTFVYALTTTDPDLQVAYIEKSRAADEVVDRIVAGLSALPFDRQYRATLAKLVEGWKGYLSIRDDVIARILVGQSSPALALDLGQAHPAFEQVKQEMTELRQELDRSSSEQLAYVTRALYRTIFETGLILVAMAAFLYFAVVNFQRRRTVEALKKVNEDLQTAQNLLQIREAEARRLADVAARTTNSVIITDLAGEIVWVNDSFSRMTGYSSEEAIGRIPGSFLHGPATEASVIEEMRSAVAEGRGFQVELVNYTKLGVPFYVAVDCQPVCENGNPSGFIAVETNTTERVRLEAGLREREHRMRMVFDHVLDAIIAIDEEGVIETANPAVERIFGYSATELVGAKISALMPSPDREQHDAHLARYLATGVRKIIGLGRQVQGRRKDGSEFPVDIAVSEVYVDGRRQFIGILRDITERCRAEEEAQRSRKQLMDLTANLPGSVFQFCKVERSLGRFLFISEGLERLCGRTAQEVMDNAYLLLASVYPEDQRAVKSELARALRTDTAFDITYRVQQGDRIRWLSSTAIPQAQESGGLVWNGVIMDVTAVKEAELKLARYAQELAQTAVQAEAAARAKSEFLATMSHEIRTPMNGVIGMTGMLLETPLTAEQRDWAETIRTSGEALLSVINDVLDFSKIEAGKLDLESHPFDLRSLLEESLELVATAAHRKRLEICALIEDDVPPWVVGDPTRLRQILLNLLSNAIKFTETGEVILSAQREQRTGDTSLIRLAVRDTGIGIREEVKGNLFQSFSQADSSTTRRYGGTGLGLAISKRLAILMGGEIGVDSVEGTGSTFWISIPLATAQSVPVAASLTALREKRILVVDDNRTNRSILKQQIGNAGMNVTVAASGAEALALLGDSADQGMPFDLGVLDLHMPVMNGLMLTREIRGIDALSSLPVIILTSDRDREEAAAASHMGVRRFLVKPVRQTALLKAITEVFGEGRESRQAAPLPEQPRFRGRVLVAEDNPTNQKVILMRMTRLGCVVDVANDGLEAVQSAMSAQYDLILMDCQMPVMDGFQATRAIRQQQGGRRYVPIIALTANAMDGERERCLSAGMDDYLAKPVRPDDLIGKLRQWLTSQSAAARSHAAIPHNLAEQFETFVSDLEGEGIAREDIASMLVRFLETTTPILTCLSESIERREEQPACFAAHSLKGSSATIGLHDLAAAILAVEQAANERNWRKAEDDLKRVTGLFREATGLITAAIRMQGTPIFRDGR